MAVAENWLPLNGELTFGITAGASCPNNIVEEIILRAYELRGASADEVLGSISAESASDVAR
jgi:4-hydroxy-3-methylbut-2-enyl diphosphate reductase